VYRIDPHSDMKERSIWKYSQIPFEEANLSHEMLREYQIGPGDEVVSAGRFVDIHGIQQITPLIRSGIIASKGPIPIRAPKSLPWKEERVWMVEMRSRTGFSGSPVFVYIPPWQPNYVEGSARKYGNWFYGPWLLGVQSNEIPGELDEGTAGSGMSGVVPCSQLEDLLLRDEKVFNERAAFEDREVDRPTATAPFSAQSTTADNPRHREDSGSLLGAAVGKPQQDGET
jgi:hypothetical protein